MRMENCGGAQAPPFFLLSPYLVGTYCYISNDPEPYARNHMCSLWPNEAWL